MPNLLYQYFNFKLCELNTEMLIKAVLKFFRKIPGKTLDMLSIIVEFFKSFLNGWHLFYKTSKIMNYFVFISLVFDHFYNMAVQVVKFSSVGYKIRKILPKNQHTQRKLLHCEKWCNGELFFFKYFLCHHFCFILIKTI